MGVSGRRRIKASDLGNSGPLDTQAVARVLGDMSSILQQLERHETRLDKLEQDHKYVWRAIESVQKTVDELAKTAKALSQYTVDHDQLHARMAQATGDSHKDLVKLVRNVVAQTDVVQQALKDAAQKRDIPVVLETKAPDVNVEIPPQNEKVNVTVERGPWEFNVKRSNNGVIDKVVATPK